MTTTKERLAINYYFMRSVRVIFCLMCTYFIPYNISFQIKISCDIKLKYKLAA